MMLFDLVLLLVCIGSMAVLWHRISCKIPELVAIPDGVIVDRLHEDSARIRVFLLNVRRYAREGAHWTALLRYAERVLYRTHIVLLKADNAMMRVVKDIRIRLDGGASETNGVGASPVRGPVAENIPPSISVPPPPMISRASVFKHSRIQEVRRKRADKTPA